MRNHENYFDAARVMPKQVKLFQSRFTKFFGHASEPRECGIKVFSNYNTRQAFVLKFSNYQKSFICDGFGRLGKHNPYSVILSLPPWEGSVVSWSWLRLPLTGGLQHAPLPSPLTSWPPSRLSV